MVPGFWNKITGGLIPTTNLGKPWWERAMEVPEDEKQKIRQEWEDQNLGVPDEEQMRDVFVRRQYMSEFMRKKNGQ
jgi:hypothetical protein